MGRVNEQALDSAVSEIRKRIHEWMENNKVGSLAFSVNIFKGGISSVKVGYKETIKPGGNNDG